MSSARPRPTRNTEAVTIPTKALVSWSCELNKMTTLSDIRRAISTGTPPPRGKIFLCKIAGWGRVGWSTKPNFLANEIHAGVIKNEIKKATRKEKRYSIN